MARMAVMLVAGRGRLVGSSRILVSQRYLLSLPTCSLLLGSQNVEVYRMTKFEKYFI